MSSGEQDPRDMTPKMRDIARAAGVSVATVSMALAGKTRVSDKTRNHILKLADEMGYKKNPLVAALMGSRRRRSTPNHQPKIAFLTFHPSEDGWKNHAFDFFSPAQKAAFALGYHLEPVWALNPERSLADLRKQLLSENIQGILFNTNPDYEMVLEMDWTPFSIVSVGAGVRKPIVHRIATDHSRIARKCVRMAYEAGHRRIGMVCRQRADDRLQNRWTGAYMGELMRLGLPLDIPPLRNNKRSLDQLIDWIRTYRLETIIGVFSRKEIEELRASGIRIPEDVSYLAMNLVMPDPDIAGFVEPIELIALTAIQTLIAMMNRNDVGIPKVPCEIFLRPHWNPGATFVQDQNS